MLLHVSKPSHINDSETYEKLSVCVLWQLVYLDLPTHNLNTYTELNTQRILLLLHVQLDNITAHLIQTK